LLVYDWVILSNIFKEICELYRFFFRLKEEERKIVFYSENAGYFSYYEGIINELDLKYQQNFCYVTSDKNDPVLKNVSENINTFYINKFLILFMQIVNCKIFIMTLTDLNKYHLKRSIHPVHYIYVFHALVSIHMMYRFGAFDHYDTIFCTGPHHIKEIKKHEKLYGLKNKELINSGYYRLERIYQGFKHYKKNIAQNKTIETILIAPSWGDQNILKSCGVELIEVLINSDFNVIVRPHPETVKRDNRLLDYLYTKFGENNLFKMEKSIISDDSIFKADVLICDCSGIALEYALGTERPVVFIDVPIKIKNNDYKDLEIEPLELSMRKKIGVIINPFEIEKIPSMINNLKTKSKKYKHDLSYLRENNIFSFGTSAEIGSDYIINKISTL